MKKVQLLSYVYPNNVKLIIGNVVYEYESSEYYCRKLMDRLHSGQQFMALNWFKEYSKLIGKEVIS